MNSKSRHLKRWLAMLLSFILCIGLLPAQTFAWVGPVKDNSDYDDAQVVNAPGQSGVIQLKNDYITMEIDTGASKGTRFRTVPTKYYSGTLQSSINNSIYQELQFAVQFDGHPEIVLTPKSVTAETVKHDPGKQHLILNYVFDYNSKVTITCRVDFILVEATNGMTRGSYSLPVYYADYNRDYEELQDGHGKTWMVYAHARFSTNSLRHHAEGSLNVINHRMPFYGHEGEKTGKKLFASYSSGIHDSVQMAKLMDLSVGLETTGMFIDDDTYFCDAGTLSYEEANPFIILGQYYDPLSREIEFKFFPDADEEMDGMRPGAETVSYDPALPNEAGPDHDILITKSVQGRSDFAIGEFESLGYTAQAWGFRNLYAQNETVVPLSESGLQIDSEYEQIATNAAKLAVIPDAKSGTGFSVKELKANENAPSDAAAVFSGTFRYVYGYYDFFAGSVHLSKTVSANFDTKNGGYFHLKPDGTIDHKGLSFSNPAFCFYKPKTDNDSQKPVFSYNKTDKKLEIAFTPANNAAMVLVDIPYATTVMNKTALDVEGNIVFSGNIHFATIFDSAKFDLARLSYGNNEEGKFKINGLEASLDIEDVNLFGLGIERAKGKVDTFTPYYHFDLSVDAFDIFSFAAELELVRMPDGTLVPNTLYGEFDQNAYGIPIIPPVPVYEISGGGLGFKDLAKTMNGDYIAIPPLKLIGSVYAKMLHTIEGKMTVTIGLTGIQVMGKGLWIPDKKGLEIVDTLEAHFYDEGMVQDGPDKLKYTGINLQGGVSAKINILKAGKKGSGSSGSGSSDEGGNDDDPDTPHTANNDGTDEKGRNWGSVLTVNGDLKLNVFGGTRYSIENNETKLFIKGVASGTVGATVKIPEFFYAVGGKTLANAEVMMELGANTLIKIPNNWNAPGTDREKIFCDAYENLNGYLGVCWKGDFIDCIYARIYYITPRTIGGGVYVGDPGDFSFNQTASLNSSSTRAMTAPLYDENGAQVGVAVFDEGLVRHEIAVLPLLDDSTAASAAGRTAKAYGSKDTAAQPLKAGAGQAGASAMALSADILEDEADASEDDAEAAPSEETFIGEEASEDAAIENEQPRNASSEEADHQGAIPGETIENDDLTAEDEMTEDESGEEAVTEDSSDSTQEEAGTEGEISEDSEENGAETDASDEKSQQADEDTDASAADPAVNSEDTDGLPSQDSQQELPAEEKDSSEKANDGEPAGGSSLTVSLKEGSVITADDSIILEIKPADGTSVQKEDFLKGLMVDNNPVKEIEMTDGVNANGENAIVNANNGNAIVKVDDATGNVIYAVLLLDKTKRQWRIDSAAALNEEEGGISLYTSSPDLYEKIDKDAVELTRPGGAGDYQITGSAKNLMSGSEYELNVLMGSEKGSSEYPVGESVRIVPGADGSMEYTVPVPVSGEYAQTGDYYLSTVLVKIVRSDLNGDGTVSDDEFSAVPLDRWESNDTIHFTNSNTPAAPAAVQIAADGNETLVCTFSEAGNADGYSFKIYQNGEDTGYGYEFTVKDTVDAEGKPSKTLEGAVSNEAAVSYDGTAQAFTVCLAPTVSGKTPDYNGEFATEEEISSALLPGSGYSLGVSAFRYVDRDSDPMQYPLHSAEVFSDKVEITEYQEADLTIELNDVAVSQNENAIYQGVVSEKRKKIKVAAAHSEDYEITVSREIGEGESPEIHKADGTPLTADLESFSGTAMYDIVAVNKNTNDKTTAFLLVNMDEVPPSLLLDEDIFMMDQEGSYTVSGITEAETAVSVKLGSSEPIELPELTGADGRFGYSGKLQTVTQYRLLKEHMISYNESGEEHIDTEDDFNGFVEYLNSSYGLDGNYTVEPEVWQGEGDYTWNTVNTEPYDAARYEDLEERQVKGEISGLKDSYVEREITEADPEWDSDCLNEAYQEYQGDIQERISIPSNVTVTVTARDENGNETQAEARVISHVHELSKVNGKEEDCTHDGLKEHYICGTCGRLFEDPEGTKQVYESDVTIPASHTLSYVAGKDATATEAGNVAHYHCSRCGKNFEDENGVTEIADVMIPATGGGSDDPGTGGTTDPGTGGNDNPGTGGSNDPGTGGGDNPNPPAQTCDHSYGSWVTVKEATALQEGEQKATCSKCGDVKKRKTAKLKASLKLSVGSVTFTSKTSIPLAYGQQFSKFTAAMKKGDSLKSAKSSGNKVVTASITKGKLVLKAAKKAGTVTITVTTAAGAKATFKVKVQKNKVAAAKIIGAKTLISLDKGKTYQMPKEVSPVTVADKVTFSTSNKKIVTVTKTGKIKAVGKGKAVITTKVGKKSFKCTVLVGVPVLSVGDVLVTDTKVPLKTGQKFAKITASMTSKDKLTSAKSNNTKIVTVKISGKKLILTAGKKTGTATITVRTKLKKTSTFKVKVQKNKVTAASIVGFKKTLTLKKGKTYQMPKAVKPVTTPDNITFKSSNSKIVAVTGGGKLTAKKKGKATITVTVGEKTFTCNVTVK